MGKKHTTKEKAECIQEYRGGKPIDELLFRYSISKTTLYRWLKSQEVKDKRGTGVQMDRKTIAELDRQRKMLAIYQRTGLETSSPFPDRVHAIQELNGEYSLNMLCLTLGIPKATYYRAIDNKETQYEIKRKMLTPIIGEIFDEFQQTIGARKIAAILKEKGYPTSPDTVAKIMHSNGWFSVRAGAKKLYLQNQKHMENMLCQQFSVSKPNEVWVSDVTEIKYGKYKYYICAVLDLFSRKVVAFHISMKATVQLVNRTIKKAFESRQPTEPLILHTDRGVNYTSKVYNQTLQLMNITHSYSTTGNPYDNSVCEAFFKTLKEEELYRHEYHSEAEMKKSVSDYIERYNSKRPHTYLHNKTPNKVEKEYFEDHNDPEKK